MIAPKRAGVSIWRIEFQALSPHGLCGPVQVPSSL